MRGPPHHPVRGSIPTRRQVAAANVTLDEVEHLPPLLVVAERLGHEIDPLRTQMVEEPGPCR